MSEQHKGRDIHKRASNLQLDNLGYYKDSLVGMNEGLQQLGAFLAQNEPFSNLRPFIIDTTGKNPTRGTGNTYSFYMRKALSPHNNSISLNLNLTPEFIESSYGRFILIPQQYISANGNPYYWVDAFPEQASSVKDNLVPVSSVQLLPGNKKPYTDGTYWHSLGERLLHDYVVGVNNIEFDELISFYVRLGNIHSYRIGGNTLLQMHLSDDETFENGDVLRFDVKRDSSERYVWLEGYRASAQQFEENWPMVMTHIIKPDKKIIAKKSWEGPEKQMMQDFFNGEAGINFNDLQPMRVTLSKTRTIGLAFKEKKKEVVINLSRQLEVGTVVDVVPQSGDKEGYNWIDIYRVDRETGERTSEQLGSVRVTEDRSIDGKSWLGYDKQLLFDYLYDSAGIVDFEDLKPITLTVGKSLISSLWKKDGEKKYLVLSTRSGFSNGDKVLLIPESESDGKIYFVLEKDGSPYARYSYDKLSGHFSTEEVLYTNSPFENFKPVPGESGKYMDESGKTWVSRLWFAHNVRSGNILIDSIIAESPFKLYEPRPGQEAFLFDEEWVTSKFLENGIALAPKSSITNSSRDTTENNFVNTVKDISQDRTTDSQKFREILDIFGGAYAVDLLFLHHPEFKDLPIDYVESVIGEYLGDYIKVSRRPLRLEDLGKVVEYLSDQNIREALYEVIKGSCLTHYNANREKDAAAVDRSIIDSFLSDICQKLAEVQSPELEEVVERAKAYYESLLQDYSKPYQFVDRLKPDRPFPDINQLVNIKELHDKNKLLIADEMGLGKSASVIMAHEMYGKGTALIVVPSNVIPTWQGYLSDKRDTKGYFKEGQAPRTLVIEDPQALEGVDLSTYDYVIISQEKLNNGYVDILEQQRFGTLIVDEIHKLKNLTDGKRAKNLVRLAKEIRDPDQYLALLSGTPVPNKVQDIAMILRLLYPEEYQDVSDRALVYSIIQGKLINLRSKLLPRMQRKSLKEGVNLPELQREQISVPLSELEQHIYEVLLEEDELTIQEKLKVLRLFLLNPEMLDSTPGIESSKADYVAEELRKDFQEHKKIVMFVNGYIEGVLRGDTTIIPQLDLSDDVEVRIIDGSLEPERRQPLIDEIISSSGKVLLLVSGQTADVGVDFSFADGVYFYNEPWTQYDKNQQESRVFREGVHHDIVSKTFVVDGTIEEGINLYIQAKERAIEKLLEGIPLSELEKELVQRDERQTESNLEVNPELAAYYFSTWEKMKKIFAHVREIGEEEFRKFLEKYGYDYATGYKEMGRRSYQSNASRVSAAFIERMVDASETSAQGISILDIASGPEMLRRHIGDRLANNVFSLDINPHHFTESSDDMHRVGSFLSMPFDDESFDFANFALAFHYTDFIPRKGKLDRLQSLMEANRVLRKGGRLVLNNLNSLDIKNMEQFEVIVGLLGFTVVEEYTGIVQSGNNFRSHVITLEKCEYFPAELEVIVEAIGKENYNGLRFAKNSSVLKDTRRIITSFEFRGATVELGLNSVDRELLLEEKQAMNEGAELKSNYGGIGGIPSEEVIKNGFIRILIGEKYILFKKLKKGSGVILIK